MNLVIVGNGGCALRGKNGKFIDNADCVVRIGNFVTSGYEEYVGSKTDIYVSRWYKSRHRSLQFFNKIKELWIPRTYETREKECDPLITKFNVKNKLSYIPKELIYSYKARYPYKYRRVDSHKSIDTILNFSLPSCGIIAIDMTLFRFKHDTIFLTGYDNGKTSDYWNPSKEYKLVPKMFEIQEQVLKEYVSSKKLILLDGQ